MGKGGNMSHVIPEDIKIAQKAKLLPIEKIARNLGIRGKYLEHYIKDVRIMNRHEKPIFYARNGAAIYISKYDILMDEKTVIGEKCLPYFMPKEKSLDIDDIFDCELIENLMKKKS